MFFCIYMLSCLIGLTSTSFANYDINANGGVSIFFFDGDPAAVESDVSTRVVAFTK